MTVEISVVSVALPLATQPEVNCTTIGVEGGAPFRVTVAVTDAVPYAGIAAGDVLKATLTVAAPIAKGVEAVGGVVPDAVPESVAVAVT